MQSPRRRCNLHCSAWEPITQSPTFFTLNRVVPPALHLRSGPAPTQPGPPVFYVSDLLLRVRWPAHSAQPATQVPHRSALPRRTPPHPADLQDGRVNRRSRPDTVGASCPPSLRGEGPAVPAQRPPSTGLPAAH